MIILKTKNKLNESTSTVKRVEQDVKEWLQSKIKDEVEDFYDNLTGQYTAQLISSYFPDYDIDWCLEEFDSFAYDTVKKKIVDAIVEDFIATFFGNADEYYNNNYLPDPYDLALKYFDMSYSSKEAEKDLVRQQYDYSYIQDVLDCLNDIYEEV